MLLALLALLLGIPVQVRCGVWKYSTVEASDWGVPVKGAVSLGGPSEIAEGRLRCGVWKYSKVEASDWEVLVKGAVSLGGPSGVAEGRS